MGTEPLPAIGGCEEVDLKTSISLACVSNPLSVSNWVVTLAVTLGVGGDCAAEAEVQKTQKSDKNGIVCESGSASASSARTRFLLWRRDRLPRLVFFEFK